MTATFGSFQLTSVGKLPNVTVAFPGEHWSDGKAASAIVPGMLVVPTAAAGTPAFGQVSGLRAWVPAAAGNLDPRAAIALNPISVPDMNPGSEYNPQLTPNEIMNRVIPIGGYVHAYRAGAFHLTLIAPDSSYAPGDLLTFDPAATALTGKPSGSGAWKKTATVAQALLEVVDWRPLTSDTTQGVLTAHTIRVQD